MKSEVANTTANLQSRSCNLQVLIPAKLQFMRIWVKLLHWVCYQLGSHHMGVVGSNMLNASTLYIVSSHITFPRGFVENQFLIPSSLMTREDINWQVLY